MTMHFRALAEQVMADHAITAEEILALRRAGWGDGGIDPAEAEAIFVINDHLAAAPAEWTDFFVEALAEFIVNGSAPRGYVSDAQADWLIGRIDHDGRLESAAELELLARIFEKSTSTPERLRDYALAQIERAVTSGQGPTRDGGRLDPGCITDAEVRLVRRFIFASGGDRPAAVSQAEAEMLFRIKDATLSGTNAAGWQQLFVQGVGNYIAGFGGREQLSRTRAAELESFMNDRSSGVGRFMGRMLRSDVDNAVTGAARVVFGRKQPAPDPFAEAARAAEVTGEEQMWLQGKLDADDRLDPLEQALLAFLAEEDAG